MKKYLLILTTTLLIFEGCNKRACLSQNSYNGIYNALTCNYQSRIDNLEESISNEELIKAKQFMEYQELLAEVNNREKEIVEYKSNIKIVEKLIEEIEINLNSLDTKDDVQPILYKIRYQVISMRNKMKIKQPYFKQSDIRMAQKHIKNNSIKKHKLKDYNKKYQNNIQVQKKIEKRLTKSIKKIIISEKENHLNQKDKNELLLALQDTKRYTTTIK